MYCPLWYDSNISVRMRGDARIASVTCSNEIIESFQHTLLT